MKTPKIVNAMNYVEDDMITASEKRVAKSPVWKRWGAFAACFAVLACSVFAAFLLGNVNASATVALDVNPSIELVLGRNERVKEVKALNEDAEKVVADMDFKGVDINVAVNAIIGSMLKNGYLTVDRNSILVSVNSKNAERAAALQSMIRADIEQILSAGGIEASVIAQSYDKNGTAKKIAEENNISIAKANLIEKILAAGLQDASGVPYNAETLAHLKVHELKLLLESKGMNLDGASSSGNAASSYIGEEKALSLALEHAKISREQVKKIEIELDYERGVMVYDVEFKTAEFEFEYEINAETGEIIKTEREVEDDD